MQSLLWLSVLVPLAGAVVTISVRRANAAVAAGAALAAALPPIALLVAAAGDERATTGFTWIPAGGGLDVGLRLDGLSAAMSATVALIGLVVLLYCIGYFAQDARAASARAGLLAFLAAMQGLVLADGYLTLLIFWELVGALSARLIAYSRDDAAAASGAVRAFVTTRAADVGFYLAVFALFAGAGTLAFGTERPDGALGALVGLGLVVAAMGKSAQAPLHTWLAGAMAGPTPVSALLHSATMVAAGVYLLVRAHELLAGWPLEVAGWIGAITAVSGAMIALAQDDLKRILAGSTTSQLGLMFVGLAAGGPAVALVYLIAHATGKAGLFLSAGIFQRQRGSTAMTRLRGAGGEDRTTFALFSLSALSIAAVPPLAGFWSKDALVVATEHDPAWLVLVLLASAGSAAYLLRPALMLWRGPSTGTAPARHRAMVAATTALAAATVVLGFAAGPLARLIDDELPSIAVTGVLLSLAATAAGAAAVLVSPRLPALVRRLAHDQLLADRLLDAVAVRPVRTFAAGAAVLDDRVIDAAVDGVATGTVALARHQRQLEERGIDAAVDGLAQLVDRSGRDVTRLQSGRLFEYLRSTVVGIAALAVLLTLTTVL